MCCARTHHCSFQKELLVKCCQQPFHVMANGMHLECIPLYLGGSTLPTYLIAVCIIKDAWTALLCSIHSDWKGFAIFQTSYGCISMFSLLHTWQLWYYFITMSPQLSGTCPWWSVWCSQEPVDTFTFYLCIAWLTNTDWVGQLMKTNSDKQQNQQWSIFSKAGNDQFICHK